MERRLQNNGPDKKRSGRINTNLHKGGGKAEKEVMSWKEVVESIKADVRMEAEVALDTDAEVEQKENEV